MIRTIVAENTPTLTIFFWCLREKLQLRNEPHGLTIFCFPHPLSKQHACMPPTCDAALSTSRPRLQPPQGSMGCDVCLPACMKPSVPPVPSVRPPARLPSSSHWGASSGGTRCELVGAWPWVWFGTGGHVDGLGGGWDDCVRTHPCSQWWQQALPSPTPPSVHLCVPPPPPLRSVETGWHGPWEPAPGHRTRRCAVVGIGAFLTAVLCNREGGKAWDSRAMGLAEGQIDGSVVEMQRGCGRIRRPAAMGPKQS